MKKEYIVNLETRKQRRRQNKLGRFPMWTIKANQN